MLTKDEEFKRMFRKSYGWARRAPDYKRCCVWVALDMRRKGKEQCPNPNGHGKYGAECKFHADKFARTRALREEALRTPTAP